MYEYGFETVLFRPTNGGAVDRLCENGHSDVLYKPTNADNALSWLFEEASSLVCEAVSASIV